MEKTVELTHQIRQNAEEFQDYVKDLVNWEKEIKKKEEEIKKRVHEDPVLPPIRTAHSSSKKKKKTTEKKSDAKKEKSKKAKEQNTSEKSARIPGYDYRAWDLFNVDEALKEDDENEKEESKKSSSEEEETEDSESEMFEMEKKRQLAVIEKDKGNQYFKKGNYDMAISCYTNGIQHDPANALLPANRAMAFLKKGQLAAAETDCTTCLSLDPTYVKAYLRRGTARMGLKKYEEARQDFNRALDMEPDNNQAKSELEKLEKELVASENKATSDCVKSEKVMKEQSGIPETSKTPSTVHKASSKMSGASSSFHDINKAAGDSISDELHKLLKPEDSDSCIIQPIQKPPHLRSQKPMVKVTVKDVTGMNQRSKITVVGNEDAADKTPLVVEIASTGNDENKEADTMSSNDREQSGKIQNTDETENSAARSPIPVDSNVSVQDTEKAEEISPVSLTSPSLPATPVTSYQFLSDWKKLKFYPQMLYEYVKQFPPEKFPVVFKQSIDTELFCGVLQTLSTKFIENGEDVFLYLKYLSEVGRFKTLVMFLAEEEVTALNQLFQFVKSSQKYSLEEIQCVEDKYGLS